MSREKREREREREREQRGGSGGRDRDGEGREEREREREREEREREGERGAGRGRETGSLFFLFFPSLLLYPWRCNPLSRQPQLSLHPLVQLHSSYDSVSVKFTIVF
jgi:hypothetical protein